MHPFQRYALRETRRAFLGRYAGAIGTLALAHLLGADDRRSRRRRARFAPPTSRFCAKREIG